MKDGPEGDTVTSALEVVQVGEDADGDDITSCVIVEAGAASSRGKVKLSGSREGRSGPPGTGYRRRKQRAAGEQSHTPKNPDNIACPVALVLRLRNGRNKR